MKDLVCKTSGRNIIQIEKTASAQTIGGEIKWTGGKQICKRDNGQEKNDKKQC